MNINKKIFLVSAKSVLIFVKKLIHGKKISSVRSISVNQQILGSRETNFN